MAACEPARDAGACLLHRPEISQIVQDALLHFEGERYRLVAWTIMPNHVHVIFTPAPGFSCPSITHSWKSFTSKVIADLLTKRGPIWERESFDHVIRSVEDLEQFVKYIEQNPVVAGLCVRAEDWLFGSCGEGFQPAPVDLVDPRTTPFAPLKSRGELPHLFKENATYFVTFCLRDASIRAKPDSVRNAKTAPLDEGG